MKSCTINKKREVMKIDVEKKSIREGIKLYEINRIYKKKYRFNLFKIHRRKY